MSQKRGKRLADDAPAPNSPRLRRAAQSEAFWKKRPHLKPAKRCCRKSLNGGGVGRAAGVAPETTA